MKSLPLITFFSSSVKGLAGGGGGDGGGWTTGDGGGWMDGP